MGLLDALGSLTMAAGEELPGITQRAAATSVKRINAAIGADFEAARVAGDVPLMTEVMNKAKAGGYNIGGEARSTEVFGVMSQGIIGFENDDEEKEKKRVDQLIALGGPAGRQAQVDRYKSLNPHASLNEIKAYEDHLNTEADYNRKAKERAAAKEGIDIEKGEIDILAKRKAFEAGPEIKTKWVKNEDGSHTLHNAETGEVISEIPLTGDRTAVDPDFAGELGGKKLSAAQMKVYQGLKQEAKKKTAQVATANQMIVRLENLLENEVVTSHLGKYGGTISDFKAMVSGSDWLPDEVIKYNSILYDMVDLSLRERSGAAVKDEEVYAEMEKIIGGTTTSPRAIKLRLNERRLTNIQRVKDFTAGKINFADMEDSQGFGAATTSGSGTGETPPATDADVQPTGEQTVVQLQADVSALDAAIAAARTGQQ